jgi:hypothetical protein
MENVSCIKYPLEDDTEATDIRYESLISFTGRQTKYKDINSYPLEDEATEKDMQYTWFPLEDKTKAMYSKPQVNHISSEDDTEVV